MSVSSMAVIYLTMAVSYQLLNPYSNSDLTVSCKTLKAGWRLWFHRCSCTVCHDQCGVDSPEEGGL